ncbi:hypothetical protein D1007_24885 [Hordeum vulgare]|nr:hypothetical protein D1007_24885 [Hordeum vulgare]
MCAPAEPSWLRRSLLPHLRLPVDLPVHFIGEKVVTATDFDPRQRRFQLPPYGVEHNLRPILTAEELEFANLSYEDDNATTTEEQGTTGEKRKKRRHRGGGLAVVVVDVRAGSIELGVSRGANSTTIMGPGYLGFINNCSFTVHDVVQMWAFSSDASPSNVEEIPLCIVIAKKPKPQT